MPKQGVAYKLTPETQEKVVQAIGVGAPYELAALYAGLGRTTVWKWVKRGLAELASSDGTAPEGPYAIFARAVQGAEGRAAIGCLSVIRLAAKKQWTAAAWLLERGHQEMFALRHRLEHSGPQGKAIPIKHEPITDPARQRAIVQVLVECGALAPGVVGTNGNGNGNGTDRIAAWR